MESAEERAPAAFQAEGAAGAADLFEAEIVDLRPRAVAIRPGSARWPGAPMLFEPRLNRRGHAVRLISALGTVVLALLIALGRAGAARDMASSLIARLAPAPHPIVTILGPSPEALWQILAQHPLHLPALAPGSPCPTTPASQFSPDFAAGLGDGMVYAVGAGATQGLLRYAAPVPFGRPARGWGTAEVMWVISLGYRGPVLVRGHQLDGPNPLGFDDGAEQPIGPEDAALRIPLSALRLLPHDDLDGIPWSGEIAYTCVRAPGCYAYQVDGVSFSSLIIFQAVPAG
jgi:hypothetical protein